MEPLTSLVSSWLYGKPKEPPPISLTTATCLLIAYALAYFLPFYASAATRPSPTLSRDAPSSIRARVRSVTTSTLLCWAATYLLLTRLARVPVLDALHLMGAWPPGWYPAAKALALTMLLFLGPLFSYFVVDAGWRHWARLGPFKELLSEWPLWRNIVAGPLTEEVLFRSASVPLMLVAGASLRQTLFLSPLIFGLSHVHHFYEFRLTNPRVPLAAALARSAFQLAYTTLFGAYATFVFVRSGSLLAACLLHAFCNAMGLPRLWGRLRPAPQQHDAGPGDADDADADEGEGGKAAAAADASLAWSVAYYVLLVAGAALWWTNLWVLTENGAEALIPTEQFSGA